MLCKTEVCSRHVFPRKNLRQSQQVFSNCFGSRNPGDPLELNCVGVQLVFYFRKSCYDHFQLFFHQVAHGRWKRRLPQRNQIRLLSVLALPFLDVQNVASFRAICSS